MLTIIIQTFGPLYAVGFSSPNKNDVIDNYNSICNLDYTSGELNWMNTREGKFFAYVWLAEKYFKEWLQISSRRIYENQIGENI